jgi:hypothetical protein
MDEVEKSKIRRCEGPNKPMGKPERRKGPPAFHSALPLFPTSALRFLNYDASTTAGMTQFRPRFLAL